MKPFRATLTQPPVNNRNGGQVSFNFEARDCVDANAFTQALTTVMNMDQAAYAPQWSGTTVQLDE